MVFRDSTLTHKLKILITLISLIKIEWFKASYVDINLENKFQIFILKKSDFFRSFLSFPSCLLTNENYISCNNFLTMQSKSYENCWALTPIGRRPFFCQNITQNWHFYCKEYKNLKIVFFAHLTVRSYT